MILLKSKRLPILYLFAVLIVLALLSYKAFAAGTTATLTWVAPTTYLDGSALPVAQIDHYTINWLPSAGNGTPGSMNVAGNVLTANVPLKCGNVTFTVSVTTTATATYPNATSAPSSDVPYATGVSCLPNPPTGLAAH